MIFVVNHKMKKLKSEVKAVLESPKITLDLEKPEHPRHSPVSAPEAGRLFYPITKKSNELYSQAFHRLLQEREQQARRAPR